jgi:hypothetical protein
MDELSEAIDFYHSLLTDDFGKENQEQLTRQLHHRQLFFGQRPLCTVLRPRFLTIAQYRQLRNAIREIMPAFTKAYEAALADPILRTQFGLEDWEESLIKIDPGFSAPSPTSRMDSFFIRESPVEPSPETGLGLFFAEYNAETPAATAYNDALSDVFMALPVMGAFRRRFELNPLPTRHHVLHALLQAYRQWGGVARPRIAILDWREVPTYSEFRLFQDYFGSQNYECIIVDPRQLEYRNRELLVDGVTPVHLIYKRVLLSELVVRTGLDNPVIQAVRERTVCMVNPFRCKLLHKKASFAVLSDESNAHLFTASERAAIQRYIPWTRLLKERRVDFHAQQIDLLPYLCQHKNNFVVKPNDEYGGKGVTLGWEVEQDEWENALQSGLESPHIVQERICIPSEPYPSLVEDQVQIYDRLIDTNPYIWDGEYVSGCLTRLSTVELLNVTAGGGSMVPTFLIERRI